MKKFACGPCSMAVPLGTLVRPIEGLSFGGRRQTERKAERQRSTDGVLPGMSEAVIRLGRARADDG
jgi:hypothetical protein